MEGARAGGGRGRRRARRCEAVAAAADRAHGPTPKLPTVADAGARGCGGGGGDRRAWLRCAAARGPRAPRVADRPRRGDRRRGPRDQPRPRVPGGRRRTSTRSRPGDRRGRPAVGGRPRACSALVGGASGALYGRGLMAGRRPAPAARSLDPRRLGDRELRAGALGEADRRRSPPSVGRCPATRRCSTRSCRPSTRSAAAPGSRTLARAAGGGRRRRPRPARGRPSAARDEGPGELPRRALHRPPGPGRRVERAPRSAPSPTRSPTSTRGRRRLRHAPRRPSTDEPAGPRLARGPPSGGRSSCRRRLRDGFEDVLMFAGRLRSYSGRWRTAVTPVAAVVPERCMPERRRQPERRSVGGTFAHSGR